jgi:tetratricopeptide (TPR) repeat protein
MIFAGALLFSTSVSAQDTVSYVSFGLSPGINIPIGQSADRYKMGGFGSLTVNYKPPMQVPLYLGADLGYGFSPYTVDMDSSLNLTSLGALVGTELPLGRLAIDLYAGGGYYYGFTKDEVGETRAGGNPYYTGGAALSFYISPTLSVGIGSSYRSYLGKPESVMNGITLRLGTTYRRYLRGESRFALPPTDRPALLELTEVRTEGVFPVFYQYYDDHPIGKIVLANGESRSVEDMQVSVFIKRYMDSPKTYQVPGALEKGEKKEIDLYALFTERVLDITEGTKVAAEISVDYACRGQARRLEHVETIRLEHRNASIWDDDRRAAAFVTAKDPAVLRFSKTLAGMVRDNAVQAVDYNMQVAMAVHRALSIYGVSYVVDPKTPYAEYVKKKHAIDFLQFPRQTLVYKAGDCDDLSILYAALLESVSVDTAFVTVPGHIYIAFALDADPEDLPRDYSRPEDFIVREGRVWIPVEVTEVGGDFLLAWETGAREWRRYAELDKAAFYPMADAWKVFEPVGLPGSSDMTLPTAERVREAYATELALFVDREIGDKVRQLKQEIARSGKNPRLVNRLGVLYARYGLYDRAEEQFSGIAAQDDYVPALMNLGNIHYLKKDTTGALAYYNRAYRLDPYNPRILVSLLRVHRDREETEQAKKTYEQLARVSPETADEYRYLFEGGSDAARAGAAGVAESLLWEE